jgi:hypothetical protein
LKEAILLGKTRKRKKKRRVVAIAMSSEDWNKVYKLDSTFFGNEPSKQQTILAVTILPALTAVLDVLMDG